VTQFFLGAIYSGDWQVSATGVACTEDEPREYALIALDPNGDGIRAGGTADVVISNGGGAMSNSSGDYCGSTQWIQTDGPLDAYDGIDICNNANVVSLPPNPSAAQVTDPMAGVSEPNCGGLPIYTETDPDVRYPDDGWEPDVLLNGPDSTDYSSDEQRFKPGHYPNGIDIRANFDDVVFEPGLYCMGDDLSLNTNSDQLTVTGSDVMFYFYDEATAVINGQHVDVTFDSIVDPGDCSNPPTAQCALFFYSRGVVSGQPQDCEELRLNGNDVNLEGYFYAPCSLVSLEGNGDLIITGQALAGEIYVRGGNDVTINYISNLDVDPAQVYLVE
jgi:hypothetical protein